MKKIFILSIFTYLITHSYQVSAQVPPNHKPFPNKVDGFYTQADTPACLFTSLVNANILAGADDTNGEFFKRFKVCLNKKGVPGLWIGKDTALNKIGAGLEPDHKDGKALLECKKDVMASLGHHVTLKLIRLETWLGNDSFILPSSDPNHTNDMCEQIKNTLAGNGDGKGSAMIIMARSSAAKHAVAVKSIICNHSSNPPKAEISIMDPNNPSTAINITVNSKGDVINSTPSNYFYGSSANSSVIAVLLEPRD